MILEEFVDFKIQNDLFSFSFFFKHHDIHYISRVYHENIDFFHGKKPLKHFNKKSIQEKKSEQVVPW